MSYSRAFVYCETCAYGGACGFVYGKAYGGVDD